MSGPSDFNDLGKMHGSSAIRAVIDGASPPANVVPFTGNAAGAAKQGDGGNSGAGGEAQIVYLPGELPASVDQGEEAIIKMPGDPRVYQRGGLLAHVVRRGPNNARNITRVAGGLAIIPVESPHLVELLTTAATWLRPSKSKTGEERYRIINAPHEVASTLMARAAWKFPPLTGVIEAPTLRPDGSVLEVPGYDRSTGLYLDTGGVRFDSVPITPDVVTAAKALDQLTGLLNEFPFSSHVDLSVALAAILTGLVGLILPARPLFGFSATVMGSGKTYLAHVVSLLATGRPAAVIAPPKDSKEEDKTLFSALLEGDPILVYDNVEHQLSSDLLCAVLTSETLRGRVLGSSRTASVSTACTFIATGNNLVIAGDLTARSLVCRLDPKSDHPEHRHFSRNLTEWIPQHRGELVPAALTFLRGFLTSGETPKMEPWQRFPEWDRLIRSAIVWAGLPDPLLALRQGEAADPRRMEHQAVMEAWSGEFEDRPVSVREAIKMSDTRALAEEYQLRDALLDVAGERGDINARRLGRWLLKMQGRLQAGMRIERGQVVNGAQTWKVCK